MQVDSLLLFQDWINAWYLDLIVLSTGMSYFTSILVHDSKKSFVSVVVSGGKLKEPSITLFISSPSPYVPSFAMNGGVCSWLPPSVTCHCFSFEVAITLSTDTLSEYSILVPSSEVMTTLDVEPPLSFSPSPLYFGIFSSLLQFYLNF